ncbi:hypothetical protein EYR40_001672 [Pleurotus pulmonarius]|nr:hypothetical protein EYR40_001672 [Pleurotus pulmonarius]
MGEAGVFWQKDGPSTYRADGCLGIGRRCPEESPGEGGSMPWGAGGGDLVDAFCRQPNVRVVEGRGSGYGGSTLGEGVPLNIPPGDGGKDTSSHVTSSENLCSGGGSNGIAKKSRGERKKERTKNHKNAKRADRRHRKQIVTGSKLKAVVAKRVAAYQNFQMAVNATDLPHARSGYIGVKGKGPARVPKGVQELIDEGFLYIPWTGLSGVGLVDAENRVVVGGGMPQGKDWQGVAERRGRFPALAVGLSYGCGQPYPMRLSSSTVHQPVLEGLMQNKDFSRIVGFQAHLFRAFAPDLAEEYSSMLKDLTSAIPSLKTNYPDNEFSTLTVNFGPQTVSIPHIDFKNLAYGLCAVTALGDFDPDQGGHLVLWDLRVVIRFPPESPQQPMSTPVESNIEHGVEDIPHNDPIDNVQNPSDFVESNTQWHQCCSPFFYVGKGRSRKANLAGMAPPFHLVSFEGIANIYPGYASDRVVDLRLKGAQVVSLHDLDDAIEAYHEFCRDQHPHHDHFGDRRFRESLNLLMANHPYIYREDGEEDAVGDDLSETITLVSTPEIGSINGSVTVGRNTPVSSHEEDTDMEVAEGDEFISQYLVRIEGDRSFVFSHKEAAHRFQRRWEEVRPAADFIVVHGIENSPVSLLRDTSIEKQFYGVRGHRNHGFFEDIDAAQTMFDAESEKTDIVVMMIGPDARRVGEWAIMGLRS